MGYSLHSFAKLWSGANIGQLQAKGYGLINCRSRLATPAVREEIKSLIGPGRRGEALFTPGPGRMGK
ncbi:MAG: hypothetical protein R6U55_03330 [Desulfovermiculus sp.]